MARALGDVGGTDYGTDDFDWDRYHIEYGAQIAGLDQELTLRMRVGDASVEGGRIHLKRKGLSLHPNHLALYEAICLLNPASVIEAGCGGGDHLWNLSVLLPACDLRGIDRSSGQLALLRRRNPELADHVREVDLTLPHPGDIPAADVVFSQAVLMHIQTGNGHRVALWNLFSLASKQVLLMENWDRHEFVRDILSLSRAGILSWDRVHLYWFLGTRSSQGSRVLIASREELDLPPATS